MRGAEKVLEYIGNLTRSALLSYREGGGITMPDTETKKNRPAELDAAENEVKRAGGRPIEVFYRESGQIQISFVMPRDCGDDVGPYTYLWDRQEIELLYAAVLQKKARVVALDRK